MENSNGDDSSTNEQSAANFYYSPIGYDFDDAAFLAGYPYSDVSDSEFEGLTFNPKKIKRVIYSSLFRKW